MALHLRTVTIANAASLSDAVDIRGFKLNGVQIPAAWTAAGLSFQGSIDGTTFGDLVDNTATEITTTNPGASRLINISPAWFQACAFVKVRSGSSSAPVNQGASRILTLILES